MCCFKSKVTVSESSVSGDATIKKEAKQDSKLDIIKSGMIKKTDGARLHAYTTNLNCLHITHTHTCVLAITPISVTQRRELANVKSKSTVSVSINGMSGTIVRCCKMSFEFFFTYQSQIQFSDAGVTWAGVS